MYAQSLLKDLAKIFEDLGRSLQQSLQDRPLRIFQRSFMEALLLHPYGYLDPTRFFTRTGSNIEVCRVS